MDYILCVNCAIMSFFSRRDLSACSRVSASVRSVTSVVGVQVKTRTAAHQSSWCTWAYVFTHPHTYTYAHTHTHIHTHTLTHTHTHTHPHTPTHTHTHTLTHTHTHNCFQMIKDKPSWSCKTRFCSWRSMIFAMSWDCMSLYCRVKSVPCQEGEHQ